MQASAPLHWAGAHLRCQNSITTLPSAAVAESTAALSFSLCAARPAIFCGTAASLFITTTRTTASASLASTSTTTRAAAAAAAAAAASTTGAIKTSTGGGETASSRRVDLVRDRGAARPQATSVGCWRTALCQRRLGRDGCETCVGGALTLPGASVRPSSCPTSQECHPLVRALLCVVTCASDAAPPYTALSAQCRGARWLWAELGQKTTTASVGYELGSTRAAHLVHD
jgi:hypothetical protein